MIQPLGLSWPTSKLMARSRWWICYLVGAGWLLLSQSSQEMWLPAALPVRSLSPSPTFQPCQPTNPCPDGPELSLPAPALQAAAAPPHPTPGQLDCVVAGKSETLFPSLSERVLFRLKWTIWRDTTEPWRRMKSFLYPQSCTSKCPVRRFHFN